MQMTTSCALINMEENNASAHSKFCVKLSKLDPCYSFSTRKNLNPLRPDDPLAPGIKLEVTRASNSKELYMRLDVYYEENKLLSPHILWYGGVFEMLSEGIHVSEDSFLLKKLFICHTKGKEARYRVLQSKYENMEKWIHQKETLSKDEIKKIDNNILENGHLDQIDQTSKQLCLGYQIFRKEKNGTYSAVTQLQFSDPMLPKILVTVGRGIPQGGIEGGTEIPLRFKEDPMENAYVEFRVLERKDMHEAFHSTRLELKRVPNEESILKFTVPEYLGHYNNTLQQMTAYFRVVSDCDGKISRISRKLKFNYITELGKPPTKKPRLEVLSPARSSLKQAHGKIQNKPTNFDATNAGNPIEATRKDDANIIESETDVGLYTYNTPQHSPPISYVGSSSYSSDISCSASMVYNFIESGDRGLLPVFLESEESQSIE